MGLFSKSSKPPTITDPNHQESTISNPEAATSSAVTESKSTEVDVIEKDQVLEGLPDIDTSINAKKDRKLLTTVVDSLDSSTPVITPDTGNTGTSLPTPAETETESGLKTEQSSAEPKPENSTSSITS